MPRLLAIVPAYNEAGAIAGVIADLRANAPGCDILVVDDGSADGTGRLAADAGASVIRLPFNVGIGGTVQTGYQYALRHGYDYAVQVDGDGQHSAADVGVLLDALLADPGLNMVTGSRFLTDRGDGYQSSASRRLGIRVFASILSRITGQRVTDPTSGLRMVDRLGIELFAHDYPHDYPEVEAVLLVHSHKLRSAELAVEMRPRLAGTSSITSAYSVVYMTKVLLAIFVGLFRARPAATLGGVKPIAAEHAR